MTGCNNEGGENEGKPAQLAAGTPDSVKKIAEERGLSEKDVEAALKTYIPSGKFDDYVLFASGGHSGQVFVIGVPSMRLLKTIAVFTPEPWQGWATGSAGDPRDPDERRHADRRRTGRSTGPTRTTRL